MTEQVQNKLDLSDAYRKSRSNISIFCGIGLAWSAAQFEIKELSFGGFGGVDLSGASISLLISFCVLYSFTRCTSEFAMQRKEVRRWSLAHFDYKLSLNLVRGSLLMLAVSGMNRSVQTAGYTIVTVLAFLVVGLLFFMLGTLFITPLIIFIRKKRAGRSIIPQIVEAEGWTRLILIILAGFFCVLAPQHPLFEKLFPNPSLSAVWIVSVAGMLGLISIMYEEVYLNKLFSLVEKNVETGVITVHSPNGGKPFSYKKVHSTEQTENK